MANPAQPKAEKRAAQKNQAFPVLVIDDNEADRRLTAIYLDQAWPFQRDLAVDFATDGSEVMEKVRHTRFALLVLDWKMPVMGGSEVLRQLRQRGIRTPVVVVSGMEREDIPEDLDQLGAGFVNKEYLNADTLRAAIAHSLRLLGFTQVPTAKSDTN
jgi:CheY-like chemotaxis protein